MPSDRDKQPRKTPPPGVIKQIAAPEGAPDSWEDQSGGGSASTGVLSKPLDVPESPTETLLRRSGETKNTALDLAVKVESLETRLDGTNAKIDAVFPVLGDLRLAIDRQDQVLARQESQSSDIIGLLIKERDRSGEIKTTATISEMKIEETETLSALELAKARELAQLEQARARELSQLKQAEADRDMRREIAKTLALRVIAGVALVGGLVATFLAGRC